MYVVVNKLKGFSWEVTERLWEFDTKEEAVDFLGTLVKEDGSHSGIYEIAECYLKDDGSEEVIRLYHILVIGDEFSFIHPDSLEGLKESDSYKIGILDIPCWKVKIESTIRPFFTYDEWDLMIDALIEYRDELEEVSTDVTIPNHEREAFRKELEIISGLLYRLGIPD